MLKAEVISIGDEITSGAILDTNGQWLSQQLSMVGLEVQKHTTVADQLDEMKDSFALAASKNDLVVVTGGLGPTADDLTRQAMSEVFGAPLVFDPASWDHIVRLFQIRNRKPTENNRIQAMFPEGCEIVENPNGSAPGIHWSVPKNASSKDRCDFWCFPGVPSEMKVMWNQSAFPSITESLGDRRRVIKKFLVKTFGAGESEVEQKLGDLIQRGNDPMVGITASRSTISLRIHALGDSEEECDLKIDPVVQRIEKSLGNLVFGYHDQELHDVILERLTQIDGSVSLVEWGTAGLISQWFSTAKNHRDRFLGSTIVSSEGGLLSRVLEAQKILPNIAIESSVKVVAKTPGVDLQLDGETTFGDLLPNWEELDIQNSGISWDQWNSSQKIVALCASAASCLEAFGSSVGLANGPIDSDGIWVVGCEKGEPDSHYSFHVGNYFSGGNPDLKLVRAAKQTLNQLRLNM